MTLRSDALAMKFTIMLVELKGGKIFSASMWADGLNSDSIIHFKNPVPIGGAFGSDIGYLFAIDGYP